MTDKQRLQLADKKKNKILYLLDSKIRWRDFKKLQDKLVKDSGPTPVHGDKILWQMLRDKNIICYFAEDMPNDMGICLHIPDRYKSWKVVLIKSI